MFRVRARRAGQAILLAASVFFAWSLEDPSGEFLRRAHAQDIPEGEEKKIALKAF